MDVPEYPRWDHGADASFCLPGGDMEAHPQIQEKSVSPEPEVGHGITRCTDGIAWSDKADLDVPQKTTEPSVDSKQTIQS